MTVSKDSHDAPPYSHLLSPRLVDDCKDDVLVTNREIRLSPHTKEVCLKKWPIEIAILFIILI